MTRVKICGITNLDDAMAAAELGADALGFVFAPSPRQVRLEQAADIVRRLPPFVSKVGVFVDSDRDEVEATAEDCGLNAVQLHGSESPEFCASLLPRVIKSFRVRDDSVLKMLPQYRVSAYLLDTYHETLKGGTGRSFDWSIAARAREYGPIILSGGLTPENVGPAVVAARPYAVDVSSGVESSPGTKEHDRIRAFIAAAKSAGNKGQSGRRETSQ